MRSPGYPDSAVVSGTRTGFSTRGCSGKDWDVTVDLDCNFLNLEFELATDNVRCFPSPAYVAFGVVQTFRAYTT